MFMFNMISMLMCTQQTDRVAAIRWNIDITTDINVSVIRCHIICVDAQDLFTCTVNVTVSVSSTIDPFNVTCKQHHRTALNPFLNNTKKR